MFLFQVSLVIYVYNAFLWIQGEIEVVLAQIDQKQTYVMCHAYKDVLSVCNLWDLDNKLWVQLIKLSPHLFLTPM